MKPFCSCFGGPQDNSQGWSFTRRAPRNRITVTFTIIIYYNEITKNKTAKGKHIWDRVQKKLGTRF